MRVRRDGKTLAAVSKLKLNPDTAHHYAADSECEYFPPIICG
jgi:hypothetical protein